MRELRRGRRHFESGRSNDIGLSDLYIRAKNPRGVFIIKDYPDRNSFVLKAAYVTLDLHYRNEDIGDIIADLCLKIDSHYLDDSEKEMLKQWCDNKTELEWTDGLSFEADIEKKGLGHFNCDVYSRYLRRGIFINDSEGNTVEVLFSTGSGDVWFMPEDSSLERYIRDYIESI